MNIPSQQMLFVYLFVVIASLPAQGQSPQQLASKFKSVPAYELRPEIIMLSKFDPSGQICEASIQPTAAGQSGKLIPPLSEGLADELIDEVVPPQERGASERFLDADSTVTGGIYRVKTNYALVTVEKVGFFSETPRSETIQFVIIKWRLRECR